MFFLLDLAGDLVSAGAFEDDLRFAAGFNVVSATSVGGCGIVSDSALVAAVASDSTVGVVVVCASAVGSFATRVSGSSVSVWG